MTLLVSLVDLTALILSEKGYTLDEKGFEEELQKQKKRSRAASEMSTDDWTVLIDDPLEEFIGYDSLRCERKNYEIQKSNL